MDTSFDLLQEVAIDPDFIDIPEILAVKLTWR